MEPARGIAWAYQAETTVTIELKSATWTELGSVDHAPIEWRVINATVGSLIDRDTKRNRGEIFNKKKEGETNYLSIVIHFHCWKYLAG